MYRNQMCLTTLIMVARARTVTVTRDCHARPGPPVMWHWHVTMRCLAAFCMVGRSVYSPASEPGPTDAASLRPSARCRVSGDCKSGPPPPGGGPAARRRVGGGRQEKRMKFRRNQRLYTVQFILPQPGFAMESSSDKGYNWILPLPSKSSQRLILSALLRNKQKGFSNCSLIVAENRDKEKIAILHLKKSIRKGQVDDLLNLKSQKKVGCIDEIKSELRSQGYSEFRSFPISELEKKRLSTRKFGPVHKVKPGIRTNALDKMARTEAKSTEGENAGPNVGKFSAQDMQKDLLICLKEEAGLEISECTDVRETLKMVSETIKKLMSDCKILFTNIEDLMDDREQDKRRIKYLTEECKDLKKLYEAKLQVQKTSYHELYDQLRNLQARCSHIQRRETEAMAESYRRFEEWKKKLSSS
jgi:hypothetical protein